MVKLLQPRITIPQICDTRIVHISHSIWTQLEKRNEWIYFIPSSDSVTIVCPNKEPVEVVLRYTGKLKIQSGCKGYSKTALLSTESEIRVNTSRNGGDLLSKVDSEFECCESLGISVNLSHVDLDMKFKYVVTHVEDLKYASFKISELEKLTREQEWKNKHTQHHKTYSILVYIVLSILITYGLYKLGKFLAHRCRTNKTIQAIAASTADHLGLTTESSGTGSIVNISIKTSNESIATNPEAIPLRDLEGATDHA
jgi:hypothetical protein